jgi:hypothetical protein
MDKLKRQQYLQQIQDIKPKLDDTHKAKLVGIEWFLEQDKSYPITEKDIKEVIDLVQRCQFVNNLKRY